MSVIEEIGRRSFRAVLMVTLLAVAANALEGYMAANGISVEWNPFAALRIPEQYQAIGRGADINVTSTGVAGFNPSWFYTIANIGFSVAAGLPILLWNLASKVNPVVAGIAASIGGFLQASAYYYVLRQVMRLNAP